jgi:copper chaperone CopZ
MFGSDQLKGPVTLVKYGSDLKIRVVAKYRQWVIFLSVFSNSTHDLFHRTYPGEKKMNPASAGIGEAQMEKQTLTVPNISCGHCVNSIKEELTEMSGVKCVDGNPDDKRITVEWEAPATLAAIKNALKEINYPAA